MDADIKVTVQDGSIRFSPGYILEALVLEHGNKKARKLLRKLLKGEAGRKTAGIPVIIPSSRDEIYERAHALLRVLGRGIGEELARTGGTISEEGVFAAIAIGAGAAIRGEELSKTRLPGEGGLLALAGWIAANTFISVFPKKEGEPEPDFKEMLAAFWRGVADETGGSRDGQ